MTFTIDVQELRTRAANSASPASPAKAARPVIPDPDPYAAFTDRYDALLSGGVDEEHAFRVAEAMCMRGADDDRGVCALECSHYRRSWCMNNKTAGVAAQLGELAFVLHRCAGFSARKASL